MKNKDRKDKGEATFGTPKNDTVVSKVKKVSKVKVKLIGQTSALNVKYEGGIIEMQNNQIVEVDKDVYDNHLAKAYGEIIILV